MLSTEIFNIRFDRSTRNFHEAGHGKGLPDAVGESLKTTQLDFKIW